MGLQWSHDIEVRVHKNVIIAKIYCTCSYYYKYSRKKKLANMFDRVDAAIHSAVSRLGFSELRPKQLLCIRRFVEGHDVFVSLPTGSGKRLCYSVLPWTFDALKRRHRSTVLVISPLDALMKDQQRSLQSRGVKAIQGTSDDNQNH